MKKRNLFIASSIFAMNLLSSDIELKVNEGWNLLSIPINKSYLTSIPSTSSLGINDLNPENFIIHYLTNFQTIWIYKNKSWLKYDFNDDIDEIFNLHPQDGFWLKSDTNYSVSFEGDSYSFNENNLTEGWSLVGAGEEINTLDIENNYEVIWKFKDKTWHKNPSIIERGEGFWIKVEKIEKNFSYCKDDIDCLNNIILNPETIKNKIEVEKLHTNKDLTEREYSIPIVTEDKNSTTIQILTFDKYTSEIERDFEVNVEKIRTSENIFFDEAFIYKFNISDSNVSLRDVKIKTFEKDNSIKHRSIGKDTVFEDEVIIDELKNSDTIQVIKNNKFEIILQNKIESKNRTYYNEYNGDIEETGTVTIQENGNWIINIRIAISNMSKEYLDKHLDENENKIELENCYVKITYGDGSVENINIPSFNIINSTGKDISELHLIDGEFKINLKKISNASEYKYSSVKVEFYHTIYKSVLDIIADYNLGKFYGFLDDKNDYENASIAYKSLYDTKYKKNDILNSWENSIEYQTISETISHRILDFDKILDKNINYSWYMSKYTNNKPKNNEDERIPLLLIHGWQGDKGLENPSNLLNWKNTELSYWQNFINYYLGTSELNKKYKLYLYKYPSYKHITYNAKILNSLLEELKNRNDTVLGKSLTQNGKGIVIIGHSMGGLVSRSLIEEYKGLGEEAEKLIKLVTLDTPHHGSPSSIVTYVRTGLTNFSKVKNLETMGALDLYWDNYDNLYDSEFFELKKDDVIKKRKEFMKNNSFDKKYQDMFSSALYQSTNPFLEYLNYNFSENNSLYKNKYIFYVAHSHHNSGKENINNKNNYIEGQKTGMDQNTELLNDIGYAAGGAEPVCSAFLSTSHEPDGVTRFKADFDEPSELIRINDSGHKNNHEIPYRYFWDYDHEKIMNGIYLNKGEWDQYIDSNIYEFTYNINDYTKIVDIYNPSWKVDDVSMNNWNVKVGLISSIEEISTDNIGKHYVKYVQNALNIYKNDKDLLGEHSNPCKDPNMKNTVEIESGLDSFYESCISDIRVCTKQEGQELSFEGSLVNAGCGSYNEVSYSINPLKNEPVFLVLKYDLLKDIEKVAIDRFKIKETDGKFSKLEECNESGENCKVINEYIYKMADEIGEESLIQNQMLIVEDLNYSDAQTYCENLTLAGFDDWTLPTKLELEALAPIFYGFDAGGEGAYYQESWLSWYFTNMDKKVNDSFIHEYFTAENDSYWTADKSDSSYIYAVNFYNGYTHLVESSEKKYVKCIKRDFNFEDFNAENIEEIEE